MQRGSRSSSAADGGFNRRRGRQDGAPWGQRGGRRGGMGDRGGEMRRGGGPMRGRSPIRGGRGGGYMRDRGGRGGGMMRERRDRRGGMDRRDNGGRYRAAGERAMRGDGPGRGSRGHDQRGPAALFRGSDRDRRRARRGDRVSQQLGPQEQRYDEANASAWTPSAGGVAGGGGGLRRRFGRVERKVWCALHGKSLPASLCEFLQDCCYACRDPSTCLSTPLEEDTTRLVNRNCTEVLCSKHHTLRHVGFMELDEKKSAYQCIAGHACRGVTVPHMGRDAAGAADSKAALPTGVAELEDDDGGYMGPRVSNTFLPQSGREAVSSFFM